MSPASNELTTRAPPPPMTMTSTSAPYFLKNPFSSATQTLPLVALTELSPILIFSSADTPKGERKTKGINADNTMRKIQGSFIKTSSCGRALREFAMHHDQKSLGVADTLH